VRIREATPADAGAVAALFEVVGYPTEATAIPARLERFERQGNGRVIVAEVEGAVVGLAAIELTYPIHHAEPVCHLSLMSVASAAQGRGVGRALLEQVEQFARSQGCRRVVVASAEHRSGAHAFYVACGWKYTGRRFRKEP
jgi:GNAT superfamily N-acetyltransferase